MKIIRGKFFPFPAAAFVLTFAALFSLFAASSMADEKKQTHEVKIQLFGQECLMRGNLNKDVLKLIHSISPEQVPRLPSPEKAAQLLKRLESAKGKLPRQLEEYREKMQIRLKALLKQKETKKEDLPQYPEAFFHQTTRSMGIEYLCDFGN